MYVILALGTLAVTMLVHLTAGAYLQLNYGLTGLGVDELLFAVLALAGGVGMVLYDRHTAKEIGGEDTADIAEVFALRLPRLRKLAGGLLLMLGGYLSASLYSQTLMNLFPEQLTDTAEAMQEILTAPELETLLLGAALLPAVCEELLFRGVTQYGFSRQSIPGKGRRPGLAAVMAAILFGVYHMTPIRIPLMILLGLLMGYALVKSGSILVPMAMHFLNNSISLALSWAVSHGDASLTAALETEQSAAVPMGTLLGLAISCLGLLALGASLLEENPRQALQKHRWIVAGTVILVAAMTALAAI